MGRRARRSAVGRFSQRSKRGSGGPSRCRWPWCSPVPGGDDEDSAWDVSTFRCKGPWNSNWGRRPLSGSHLIPDEDQRKPRPSAHWPVPFPLSLLSPGPRTLRTSSSFPSPSRAVSASSLPFVFARLRHVNPPQVLRREHVLSCPFVYRFCFPPGFLPDHFPNPAVGGPNFFFLIFIIPLIFLLSFCTRYRPSVNIKHVLWPEFRLPELFFPSTPRIVSPVYVPSDPRARRVLGCLGLKEAETQRCARHKAKEPSIIGICRYEGTTLLLPHRCHCRPDPCWPPKASRTTPLMRGRSPSHSAEAVRV